MTTAEFTKEVSSLQPTLRMLTHRFTFDRDESLDLIQETLMRAFLYRAKFKRGTNLKGWLFTIMRNTYINRYRKAKREKTSRDVTKDLFFLHVEDENNRSEEPTECKEIWEQVDAVRDEFQIPFKMYLTGYKYEEIADHLQIPVGTVKNRIFHARKEIQKKLHGYR